jgi:hypothetical protein
MTKRMLLAFGLLFALGLVALMLVWRAPRGPAPEVTAEACHRLRQGMSEAEVKAILGQPSPQAAPVVFQGARVWKGERCQAELNFDAFGGLSDGVVLEEGTGHVWQVPPPERPPAWEQLRGLLVICLLPAVLVAFGVALGYLLWRVSRRCPGCGRYRMSRTGGIVVTGPGGSPGAFYACGNCRKQWYWSNAERAWHEAAADTQRQDSAGADR